MALPVLPGMRGSKKRMRNMIDRHGSRLPRPYTPCMSKISVVNRIGCDQAIVLVQGRWEAFSQVRSGWPARVALTPGGCRRVAGLATGPDLQVSSILALVAITSQRMRGWK